ncbi:MAG: DNA-3-methyladenine glycosylase 2 family protein [Rubrivivax sp.]|nr:DNA-3-methyladenine glycosylase 2 family protein [Pyrinomonadaceae bacterium]
MNFSIQTPDGFDFKRTLRSHGWCELLPFETPDNNTLIRVLDVGDGAPVTVKIKGGSGALDVSVPGRPIKSERARVEREVRHIFRLDDLLTEFYERIKDDPDFGWIARDGAGRLLRSTTVYEDLVKSICTTNCSWSLTMKMVAELVGNLGREAADGRRSFPTPEAMAAQPAQFYRDVVRAGYRSEYLKELADRVAVGEMDVEFWLESELPTAELKREMKRVKGVGDYAAENLLKLVGRYDVLALDSWVRGKFVRVRNQGRACEDKKIARFYLRFKEWRGLALWCDMTRDWFDETSDSSRIGDAEGEG